MSAGAISLHYIIESAVILNYSNRINNENEKLSLLKPQWLKDFCTIQINCGRITGKTKYIASKVNDPHTLILTNNRQSKKELESYLVGNITNIFTYWSNNPHIVNSFKDIDLNDIYYVYVDEPTLTFREHRHLIDFYCMFTQCKSEPTFIMLGE